MKYQHRVAHRLVITSVYFLEISAFLALLTVLLLLKEEIVLHSLLLHLELPPHKIVMAMEYLTQLINVLITQTQDASKKEIRVQQLLPHNNNNNNNSSMKIS